MMRDTDYYLAVDIGASSGRHILGRIEGGRLALQEVHRFRNGAVQRDGRLVWDMDRLFDEVVRGIEKCGALGKRPVSLGIDTWGVDFALLDRDGHPLGDCVCYRDSRTRGIPGEFARILPDGELYARTGIQRQVFNTLYQLIALGRDEPRLLERARTLLLVPEYLSYRLTGVIGHEYTNATTTGMVNADTRTWDRDLLAQAGIPTGILGELSPPGTELGGLLPQLRQRAGFDCQVVLPCTHDTASAVLAAPLDGESLYLSSGTWSLMGAELDAPICTRESRKANFTNEGGYGGTVRYLKNIMGLWIIQQVRRELGGALSFSDLEQAARRADFPARVDVNDERFLSPVSMTAALREACEASGQRVPETPGELISCVYHSLADSYAATVGELEAITGRAYSTVCIVGGGSKDSYLNELTARTCARRVTAGPAEGTATGNLLAQLLRAGDLSGVEEARALVRRSFPIRECTLSPGPSARDTAAKEPVS